MKSTDELEKLEERRHLNADEYEEFYGLCRGLMEIYKREETMWQQRAKCKWLKEGDVNTTFFHRVASFKKHTNTITFLELLEGCIQREKDIRMYTQQHFKSIFTN